ncbi:hypothetical protein TA3x_002694 [Tundrisphaera sp. TA3]|uniref:hypothetical protein n=1 Tax=Tundrisphaera sp. TA3 TaxID=3435775 RepID=UPI003EBF2F02
MLDAGQGVGLELFEFAEPDLAPRGAEENQEFDLHWTGAFHFCVFDPDVEGLARRIVENRGKQRCKIWEFAPGFNFDFCPCENPFGDFLEIQSHGTAQIWSTLA